MKWKVVLVIALVLVALAFVQVPPAAAGNPIFCSGLPTAERTLSCLETWHADVLAGCDPQVWLKESPFLAKLAPMLKQTSDRVACAFGNFKYHRLWEQAQMYPQDAPKSATEVSPVWNLRNAARHFNDEEAFCQMFNAGQGVFAVNQWTERKFIRYRFQFCDDPQHALAKCW